MNTYIIDKSRLGCVRIKIIETSKPQQWTKSFRATFVLEKVLKGDYLKSVEGETRHNIRLEYTWIYEFEDDEQALLFYEVME